MRFLPSRSPQQAVGNGSTRPISSIRTMLRILPTQGYVFSRSASTLTFMMDSNRCSADSICVSPVLVRRPHGGLYAKQIRPSHLDVVKRPECRESDSSLACAAVLENCGAEARRYAEILQRGYVNASREIPSENREPGAEWRSERSPWVLAAFWLAIAGPEWEATRALWSNEVE